MHLAVNVQSCMHMVVLSGVPGSMVIKCNKSFQAKRVPIVDVHAWTKAWHDALQATYTIYRPT